MKNLDRTPFGARMFEARKAAGMTQQAVQKAIGVSQSTLSEAENKAHSSGLVAEFAALYKVDPLWLATGAGSPELRESKSDGIDWHTVALGLAARWAREAERPLVMHFVKSVAQEVARMKEFQAESEIPTLPMREEGVTL